MFLNMKVDIWASSAIPNRTCTTCIALRFPNFSHCQQIPHNIRIHSLYTRVYYSWRYNFVVNFITHDCTEKIPFQFIKRCLCHTPCSRTGQSRCKGIEYHTCTYTHTHNLQKKKLSGKKSFFFSVLGDFPYLVWPSHCLWVPPSLPRRSCTWMRRPATKSRKMQPGILFAETAQLDTHNIIHCVITRYDIITSWLWVCLGHVASMLRSISLTSSNQPDHPDTQEHRSQTRAQWWNIWN